ANSFRFGKRQYPAKAEVKSEIEALFSFRRAAREAMENARSCVMLAQDLHRVDPGLPRVDDDRLPGVARELQLPHEYGPLDIARRKIVVVVEADLAQCQNLGVREQIAQPVKCIVGRLGGIVRMDAYRGVEKRIAIGQPSSRLQIGGTVAGADRHHSLDSRRQ